MSSNSNDAISTGDYIDRRKLTWKIDNFDEIRKSEPLVLTQNIHFNVGSDVGFPTEWICFLFPFKAEGGSVHAISVGIYLALTKTPRPAEAVIASFQVGINKSNVSYPPIVRNFIENGEVVDDDWGWKHFIKPEIKSPDVTVDGSLILEIEVKIYSAEAKTTRISVTEKEKIYGLKFAHKLQEDMEKLLVEPVKNSDSETKIISKDGIEFIVFRAILSARSPVFETMFQADMEESRTGIVRITDLSSEAIEVLLHFIYTGKLREDWKSTLVLPELMYAAGKYQFADLLSFLDDVSGQVCSKENAGRLVGHARKLGLKNAETDLVEFMKKNICSLDDIISFAEDSTAPSFV